MFCGNLRKNDYRVEEASITSKMGFGPTRKNSKIVSLRNSILKVMEIKLEFLNFGSFLQIVKTPTPTSIQLNTITIDVGFDTIMAVHTQPPPPTQELYLSYIQHTVQYKSTQSLTILLDYLRQLY